MNPEVIEAIRKYEPPILWLTSLLVPGCLQVVIPIMEDRIVVEFDEPVNPNVKVRTVEYAVVGRRDDGVLKMVRADVLDKAIRRDM